MSLTRRDLFDVWHQQRSITQKNLSVLTFVLAKLGVEQSPDDEKYNDIIKIVGSFNSKVAKMWKESKRTLKVFEVRHCQWLNEKMELFSENVFVDTSKEISGARKGRPFKDFSEVNDQSKRRKILPLLENYSLEELTFATSKSLNKSGRKDAARLVKEVSASSPKRATRIKKAYQSTSSLLVKYTPEEALALFVDGRYTKKSYILMQQGTKSRNANIYPNYNIILDAKKKCYPGEEHILITDISAEVSLQMLVHHTARRILVVQKYVFNQFFSETSISVTLLYKWGCDGSHSGDCFTIYLQTKV